jgi:hypothetical protein
MNHRIEHLRSGDVVEVRSEEEIRLTLDVNGTLESVPFMPEMVKYCGHRFVVSKRADKICVEKPYFHLRQMKNAVFLEGVYCNGEAHDGCRRLCRIFWKEVWLRRVENIGLPMRATVKPDPVPPENAPPIDNEKTYVCQSTEVYASTSRLKATDPRQYFRDLYNRDFTLREVIIYTALYVLNKIRKKLGKPEYGTVLGDAEKTPKASIGLLPGELVEVKSREEIVQTLDRRGTNRGLGIDLEMLQHCGKRFAVLTRVDRIILETTGKMREIHNTVALTDVTCGGLCKRGCTRGSYPMWREAWLKRVEDGVNTK